MIKTVNVDCHFQSQGDAIYQQTSGILTSSNTVTMNILGTDALSDLRTRRRLGEEHQLL